MNNDPLRLCLIQSKHQANTLQTTVLSRSDVVLTVDNNSRNPQHDTHIHFALQFKKHHSPTCQIMLSETE